MNAALVGGMMLVKVSPLNTLARYIFSFTHFPPLFPLRQLKGLRPQPSSSFFGTIGTIATSTQNNVVSRQLLQICAYRLREGK